jgi:hypothetical protein
MSEMKWKKVVLKCFAEATLEMISQGSRRILAPIIKRRRLIRWSIATLWLLYKLSTNSLKLEDTLDNIVVNRWEDLLKGESGNPKGGQHSLEVREQRNRKITKQTYRPAKCSRRKESPQGLTEQRQGSKGGGDPKRVGWSQ